MKERLSYLDGIRALAILMVIGIHGMSYDINPSEDAYQNLFFILAISVPIFFVVDGFLLARSIEITKSFNYTTYIKNSANRLLVPWVIFSLFYLGIRYVAEMSSVTPLHKTLVLNKSISEVMYSLYGSVYSCQLYFLPTLFLVRVSAPLLKRFVVKTNLLIGLGLLIAYTILHKLFVTYFAGQFFNEGGVTDPILASLWAIRFFAIGILFFKVSQIVELKKIFWLMLSICITSVLFQNHYETFVYFEFRYIYLIMIFLFFAWLPWNFTVLDYIGKNTMGIYLIHAPIVIRGVSMVVNSYVLNPTLNYVAIVFGTLVMSLVVIRVIVAIPYGSLLFGIPYKLIYRHEVLENEATVS